MAFKDPIPKEIREKDFRGELTKEEWNFWMQKYIEATVKEEKRETRKMIFSLLGSIALMFIPALIPSFLALFLPYFVNNILLGAFDAFCLGVMVLALFNAPREDGFYSSEFGVFLVALGNGVLATVLTFLVYWFRF